MTLEHVVLRIGSDSVTQYNPSSNKVYQGTFSCFDVSGIEEAGKVSPVFVALNRYCKAEKIDQLAWRYICANLTSGQDDTTHFRLRGHITIKPKHKVAITLFKQSSDFTIPNNMRTLLETYARHHQIPALEIETLPTLYFFYEKEVM